MNEKQYKEQRTNLLNETQQLINEGKGAEADKKMEEVKALDAKWDALTQAQANFNALNGNVVALNPFGSTEETLNNGAEDMDDPEAVWASEVYTNAWAKKLMNKALTNEESRAFQLVNEAYTHTTGNTNVVIPESVSAGIWEEAGEMYPYFGDISKTYVNGMLTIPAEDTSSDAFWYDEETETKDGKETIREITFGGCELSRSITVSWKLKEMAIKDFIPYIQRKMAKKMGAGLGYGSTHGKGVKEGQKPEPVGVVTALEAESGTPQVVTYSGTEPSYKEVLAARGKIKGGYSDGLALYANSNTIWTQLANIVDSNKRPIFVADPINGGVYRVLGAMVKEDDSMLDGEILFSNAERGYHMNVNKEVTMLPEDHIKERKTDYCGYAIADGKPMTTKAHSLLKKATS